MQNWDHVRRQALSLSHAHTRERMEGKGIQGNFRCWDLGLSRYSQKEARHLEENRFRIFFFFFLRPGLIFEDRFHNEIGKYTRQWQIILLVTMTCLRRLMVYAWRDVYPNRRPCGLAFMGKLLCAGHCLWGWGHSRDRRSRNSHPQRLLSIGACPRYIP